MIKYTYQKKRAKKINKMNVFTKAVYEEYERNYYKTFYYVNPRLFIEEIVLRYDNFGYLLDADNMGRLFTTPEEASKRLKEFKSRVKTYSLL